MGVDLCSTTTKERCNTWRILDFIWLSINTMHVFFTVKLLVDEGDKFATNFVGNGGIRSDTFFWNVVMDGVNFASSSLVAHLILILFVKKRWTSLSQAINFFCDVELSTKIRRMSFSGLVYIGLWVRLFYLSLKYFPNNFP